MVTKLNSLYPLLQGLGNIMRKEVKNVRNELEKEARITKGMSCRHDMAIGLITRDVVNCTGHAQYSMPQHFLTNGKELKRLCSIRGTIDSRSLMEKVVIVCICIAADKLLFIHK